MRRVPKEQIKNHHSLDNLLIKRILGHVKIKDNINIELVTLL